MVTHDEIVPEVYLDYHPEGGSAKLPVLILLGLLLGGLYILFRGLVLKDTLLALLRADPTLMALLPGGIHGDEQNSNSLAQEAINRQDTPDAFDANTLELLPCALLLQESDAHADFAYVATTFENAYRTFIRVTFYLDVSGAARARVWTLLNMTSIPGDKVWQLRHTDDVIDQDHDALKAALDASRYEAVYLRV